MILSATWRDVGIGARYAAAAPQEFRGAPTTVVTADFGLREEREASREGELRRERTERCSLGIDLDRDASIQRHPDEAADVDVLDDAAIARAETRIVFRITNELDPRTDGHTRTNGPQGGVRRWDPWAAYRLRRPTS